MEQVSFDTHAAARRLVQAGASSRLAQAVVETVAEATRINTQILEDLAYLKHQAATSTASKTDLEGVKGEIAGVKGELQTQLAGVKGELKAEIAGLKGELKAEIAGLKGELKAEIAGVKTDLEGVRGESKTGIAGVWGELKIVQNDLASFKSYVESHMITKKELYRALWVQSMGMAGLIVGLMGIMLWFVRFTLISA